MLLYRYYAEPRGTGTIPIGDLLEETAGVKPTIVAAVTGNTWRVKQINPILRGAALIGSYPTQMSTTRRLGETIRF